METENKEKLTSKTAPDVPSGADKAKKKASLSEALDVTKKQFGKIKCKAAELYKRSGKRAVAVLCSLVLIGSAVALNFVLFTEEAGTPDSGKGQLAVDLSAVTDGGDSVPTAGEGDPEEDYFATVSLGRRQARDEAMEVLLEVTNDENATAEAKSIASADINRIALDIEREGTIESLVKAKGFEECVAIVNGESASVIVGGDTLTPGEAAQISEIVYEAAGIVPANLKIVESAQMN